MIFFLRVMSQVVCLNEHLANATRVNTLLLCSGVLIFLLNHMNHCGSYYNI